ncbi:hypothetical protein ACNSOB_10625 [Citrobacter braakii]|uniref:hypothetical protein n=1 Tax=Citrobacter braakii TaxID=57706 RepID=UPI003AB75A0D
MLASLVSSRVLRLKPRKVRLKGEEWTFCTPEPLILAALEEVDAHQNGAKE